MLSESASDLLRVGSRVIAKITDSKNHTNTSIPDGKVDPGGISAMAIVLVFFYGLVASTAFISNMMILITVLRGFVPRNTVNLFLSSLAFSDLIMVVLSLFDGIAFAGGQGWTFGEGLCKIQSYFLEVSFTASTLTLVAVSLERYLLICHPHMKRRTINAIYRILCCVWLGALLACSPLLHGYAVIFDTTEKLKCGNFNWHPKHRRVFYGIYSIVVYLFPLLIMAFAHWQISVSVKDNGRRASRAHSTLSDHNSTVCFTIQEEKSDLSTEKNASSLSQNDKSNGVHKSLLNSLKRRGTQCTVDRDYNRREKRLKAIKLLFVVTIVFFLLWSPFIIMRIMVLFGVQIKQYIYTFGEILIFSSTAVNGFIYAFMSPPFRKAFKGLICCQSKREFVSRDSAPSFSNSEDNRLMTHRMNSRGSSVSYPNEYSVKSGHIAIPASLQGQYILPKKDSIDDSDNTTSTNDELSPKNGDVKHTNGSLSENGHLSNGVQNGTIHDVEFPVYIGPVSEPTQV